MANRDHRKFVGGLFDAIGLWQFNYLKNNKLISEDTTFLDLACGSLRLGRHIIPYLKPGHYYGLDSDNEILQAGIKHELFNPDHMEIYRPVFDINSNFDMSFCKNVDIVWANSLFSHLTISDITDCVKNISTVSTLFVFTYFDASKGTKIKKQNPDSSHPNKDFVYEFSDIDKVFSNLGWSIELLKDQTHPKGQTIVKAVKT